VNLSVRRFIAGPRHIATWMAAPTGCGSCDDCQVSTTEIPQRFQMKGSPDEER